MLKRQNAGTLLIVAFVFACDNEAINKPIHKLELDDLEKVAGGTEAQKHAFLWCAFCEGLFDFQDGLKSVVCSPVELKWAVSWSKFSTL